MKSNKIIYYIGTGLFTFFILFGAYNYLFNTAVMKDAYTALGYPSYLVVPMAIVKLFGLVAVWSRKNALLKEWAYAGFFFDFVLAFTAHYMVGDGQGMFAALALIGLIISRVFEPKAFSIN